MHKPRANASSLRLERRQRIASSARSVDSASKLRRSPKIHLEPSARERAGSTSSAGDSHDQARPLGALPVKKPIALCASNADQAMPTRLRPLDRHCLCGQTTESLSTLRKYHSQRTWNLLKTHN
jgi:hypothetical protein